MAPKGEPQEAQAQGPEGPIAEAGIGGQALLGLHLPVSTAGLKRGRRAVSAP